jgi:hypothetical protein
MTTPTHRASDVTNEVISRLKLISGQFGIKQIYYGNQEIIAAAPAVCVLPSTIDRDWQGSSLNVNNDFQISLLVYSTSLREGSEVVQANLDILTEDIADYFNVAAAELTLTKTFRGVTVTGDRLSGLVTQGLSTRIEYSYRTMSDELMRMNRIIFIAMSRTGLVP